MGIFEPMIALCERIFYLYESIFIVLAFQSLIKRCYKRCSMQLYVHVK